MTDIMRKYKAGGNVRMVINPSHLDTNTTNLLLPIEITLESHNTMGTAGGDEMINRCKADTWRELFLITATGKSRPKIIGMSA